MRYHILTVKENMILSSDLGLLVPTVLRQIERLKTEVTGHRTRLYLHLHR